MRIPPLLHHRDFRLYWSGVVLSEVGTRGTFAANLYHIYALTGSTVQTGLVGLAQAVALVVLSPLGGAYADRLDRRRLLQVTQLASLATSLVLAVLTLVDVVQPWQILVSVLLNSAAQTFDRPARQALIPALVPRSELVQAFALITPSREVAVLVGPALAGLLMAIGGPEAMYLVDVGSYAALIVALQLIRHTRPGDDTRQASVWVNIAEGFAFVRRRPLILQLIGLDLAASLFGAYRAVLPALAADVLRVGPTGYGVLSAAPSAGALIGSAIIFRLAVTARSGHVVLWSTAAYGLSAVALAQSRGLAVALLAAAGLGICDAMATTIRHAAVQLETPDEIRGRVTATYQIASRGGPAAGDMTIGALAGVLGPAAALSLGGLVPVAVAAGVAAAGRRLRAYRVPRSADANA